MNIVIRVDASHIIGSGHVMRCIVLAQEFRLRGHTVKFASIPQEGDLIDYVRSSGFAVLELMNSKVNTNKQIVSGYDSWLPISWQEDLKEFQCYLNGVDLVVVDHYGIDIRWETKLRENYLGHLFVIDDLNRNHNCDIILDQNLWEFPEERYRGLNSIRLLGPDFSLLRKRFFQLRNESVAKRNQVLAFFGGADITSECFKLLCAVKKCGRLPFKLKIVSGGINQRYFELKKLSKNTDVDVYKLMPDFDLELKLSRYCIGASGVSNWERFCLNIPSSVVSVAENQIELSEYLASIDAIRYIGEGSETAEIDYIEELEYIKEFWPNFNKNMNVLVDGLGASKVVDSIERLCRVRL